ncbi:sigma-70 family RNA polymerase sigma factor [Sphingobacterium sp. N143]|uniref:RNA polymerase sigma factor n=1 Tax=Sphingobacterium sp. N143 TaxID=2746727 RepID=UPI0025791CD8|nr:sigma-70 family RNA polymerase sigma factor [Sphingobacterium sp. N143]MDM1295654.1 sigma-70 family RNA polymerase sigma factor [Sphingobacterium sp. N143]
MDDFHLLQAGDQSVFGIVFNYYQPIIYFKARQFCKNDSDAEEVTQEVFIEFYLKRMQLSGPEAIFPFLFTIAKRMAISNFRKSLVRSNYLQSLQQTWLESSSSLQEELDAKELQAILESIIDQLPPQQQAIYRMNKFEEQSYQEIADQAGLSKNTVRNHLSLASKFVRFKLDKILSIFFF